MATLRAYTDATREIMRVVADSRHDEQPVFEAILKSASRLCDAPFAGLGLCNGERTHVRIVALEGATDECGRYLQEHPIPIDAERSGSSRAVINGEVYHIGDMRKVGGAAGPNAHQSRAVDVEGMRTYLAVPLMSNGIGIGYIGLYRTEVLPFTDEQIALIKTFATQAVIAIENVRQFRELQTRLEHEAATRELLSIISQSRDDETPVFQTIVKSASRLCNSWRTTLALVDDARENIVNRAGGVDGEPDLFAGDALPLTDSGGAALAIRERRLVHEANLATSELYRRGHEQRRKVVDELGVQSLLTVPIFAGDEAIGCINLMRKEPEPFENEQIRLIESFAAQAVIAIENVRQFRELQTRLEREAATREILSVISQSPDDESPVFDVIVKNAARLCNAPMARLLIANEERTHFKIAAGWGIELQAISVGELMELDPAVLPARVIMENKAINLPDMRDGENYRSGLPVAVRMVEEEGIRTLLMVPLSVGDRAIGAFVVNKREVAPFTNDEIALVESFAAQAVIAIENVRQFRELQTRLEREEATRRILSVISQSRDDENPVFNVIVENAAQLCATHHAGLILVDENRENVVLAAMRSTDYIGLSVGDTVSLHGGSATSAGCIFEGRVVHFEDLANDELYKQGDPHRRLLVDRAGARSLLNVPLILGKQAIGAISLQRNEVKPFTQDEIAMVQGFAAQAVIAIENVRQFRALETLNAELGDRVDEQVGEIERMGRLKRFLSPAVADAVVSSGGEEILGSHRALIGILFCDIRGFTAFCETAEPEETIEFLQTYHEEMGKLINAHGAGVDHRWGDGIMVIFNDPFPCEDPAGDALRLALAMREKMAEICQRWKRLGHRLGFGVGISLGYATVGMVGSEGRFDYTANGTAVNLAARLCDHAEDGEILLSPRAYTAVEDDFQAESIGKMTFKGIRQPVEVFRVVDEPAVDA